MPPLGPVSKVGHRAAGRLAGGGALDVDAGATSPHPPPGRCTERLTYRAV